MADANTGSSGTIRIDVSESGQNAAANTSVINWAFYLIERVTSNSTWRGSGISASVDWSGVTTLWSGSFGFDWRPAGNQTTLIASGSFTVTHNPDGGGSVTIQGNMGSTGTSGAGGPTSVAQSITLTQLTVAPGTPTSVAAVRNSDTRVTVSWAESSASNGKPQTNDLRRQVNNGSWDGFLTISAATSTAISAAANQKLVYSVRGWNSGGGASAWSASSSPVFTTPAAPTAVAAAKTAALDIVVSFIPNVAFTEHRHIIVHGIVAGGVTTWDGSPLATLPSGTTSYTHAAPPPSAQHIYKVYAKNTSGGLASAEVTSNTVQLLTAPNKPTLPALGPNADKGLLFKVPWTHNPVDTTAQTAYEIAFSTNGGASWSSTGKVASTLSSNSFAANSFTAGQGVTFRVRTWGQATSGGSDGTGASPWSDQQTVTFRTRPVATITQPTNSSTYDKSALDVHIGFSQAEGATFVSATIQLFQGTTLLETLVSTTLASTMLNTVANGSSYSVKATVLDSNGLVSDQVTASFTVSYTLPVPPVFTATYLPDSGIGQLAITIAAPGSGQVAAVTVSVTRAIDGNVETVVDSYPVSSSLTILDMTPTIHGDNVYTVTTKSSAGATAPVSHTLTTAEDEWAFMSTGSGYTEIIQFGGELKPQATPTVDATLVKASGRSRPIGMYATTGGLVVSGTGEVVAGLGSSPEEIEAFLLAPGKGCYRDPTGRRMFGLITGQISRDTWNLGTFTYTVTETS